MKNKISEFRTPKEQLLMFILYEEDMQLMVEFKHHCKTEYVPLDAMIDRLLTIKKQMNQIA